MLVRFNALDRLEQPVFTLCNPGSEYTDGLLSKAVGILVDTEAEEISFNFNATSELNLRVNLVRRENAEQNRHVNNMFAAIQTRRLLFVKEYGYFVITNITNGYRDGIRYKDITAKSCEIELEQKTVPFFEDGTYRFIANPLIEHPNPGIMDMVMERLPMWSIDHIDSGVAERYRTFEDVDISDNCLSFLMERVQEAYECIFVFDNVTRTISVYDQNTYVRPTSIHLTTDDLINELEMQEDANDVYTALSVFGEGEISINTANPLGTSTIYDFSHYLGWMTPGLRSKVRDWQDDIADVEESYQQWSFYLYQELETITECDAELERLQILITLYQRCMANIVAETNPDIYQKYNESIVARGGDPIDITGEYETIDAEITAIKEAIDDLIEDCQYEMDLVQAEKDRATRNIPAITVDVYRVQHDLALENYFTAAELEELSQYIFEGRYTDEYILLTDQMDIEARIEQMKELYRRSKQQLKKIAEPTREFSIDTESFVFERRFEQWSSELETGCLVNVEVEEGDVAQLFLTNIIINYDDHNLQLKFGNRFNKYDIKTLYEKVLGNVERSANSLSYVWNIIDPLTSGDYENVKSRLDTIRTLTMDDALESDGQEVVIDSTGYTGRRSDGQGGYDDRQIKIVNNNIVMTDDNWETAKIAIGEMDLGNGETKYGVNADMIVAGEINAGVVSLSTGDGGFCCASGDDGSSATQGAKIYGSLGKNGDTYVFVSGSGARMQCGKSSIYASAGGSRMKYEDTQANTPVLSTVVADANNAKMQFGDVNYLLVDNNGPHASRSIIVDSDKRLKQNIAYDYAPYEALFRLLKPATYQYIHGSDDKHMGLIAQDVEKAAKQIGLGDEKLAILDKYQFSGFDGKKQTRYGLRYEELIALCIHMIQKQQGEIDDLKRKYGRKEEHSEVSYE